MTHRQHNTFYAGLGVGAGLCGIRLAAAQTYGDVFFTAALTVTELSVVWLWEKKVRHLGDLTDLWKAGEKDRARAAGLAEAADANLEDRQRLVDEAIEEIKALDREAERDYLLGDLKALQTTATSAIRAGYFAGLADNNGAVNGGEPQEEDHDDE